LGDNSLPTVEVKIALTAQFIAGRSTFDERHAGALKTAHDALFRLVAGERFALTKTVSDDLHELITVHPALEVGHFRGQGIATPGSETVVVGAARIVRNAEGIPQFQSEAHVPCFRQLRQI
jgi:hypothetical protein